MFCGEVGSPVAKLCGWVPRGVLQLYCLPGRAELVLEELLVTALSCLPNEVFVLQRISFLPKTSKDFVVAASHRVGKTVWV